jgi:hypothetical protein
MDTTKINLTIDSAFKELENIEQALRQNNQRAVGAALASARHELDTLKKLINEKPQKRKADKDH